jgi:acetyltransferase-like isoleucine patch superfamily enzyme
MKVIKKALFTFINFSRRKWISWNQENLYLSLGILDLNPSIEYPWHFVGFESIKIGRNFISRYNLRIEAIKLNNKIGLEMPKVIIGDNVCINSDVHIGCIDLVSIGDNCLIGSKVLISDHDHGKFDSADLKLSPGKRKLFSKGGVVIERNVWIGEFVSILSGVTVGENSVVASNSVVTRSIPPNSLVAGIPAKIVKSLG